ncbi:MAG TPA: hypothetical protein ENN13_01170 [Candidatus Altiarchaeales archaeon]|nr:hypothetical protein [Candidatus Altiarchaeales archaeon]
MEFNLTLKSLQAQRYVLPKGNININNNSTVTDVSGGGDALTVSFVFTSTYEPNVGLIRIEGDLDYRDGREVIEKALEKWRESGEKNLPKDLAERLHNNIINNCLVEASVLARDIRLPLPLPSPKVKFDEEKPDTDAYIR